MSRTRGVMRGGGLSPTKPSTTNSGQIFSSPRILISRSLAPPMGYTEIPTQTPLRRSLPSHRKGAAPESSPTHQISNPNLTMAKRKRGWDRAPTSVLGPSFFPCWLCLRDPEEADHFQRPFYFHIVLRATIWVLADMITWVRIKILSQQGLPKPL